MEYHGDEKKQEVMLVFYNGSSCGAFHSPLPVFLSRDITDAAVLSY